MSSIGKDVVTDSKEERLEQVAQELYQKSYKELESMERRRVGSVVGGQSANEGYTDTMNVKSGK